MHHGDPCPEPAPIPIHYTDVALAYGLPADASKEVVLEKVEENVHAVIFAANSLKALLDAVVGRNTSAGDVSVEHAIQLLEAERAERAGERKPYAGLGEALEGEKG